MKNILKSKIVLLLIIVLSLVLVGCKGGEGPGEKDNFNEANYELTTTPTFEKTLTSSEAKAELAKAVASLATTKSYSYTQKLTGEWDSQYTYEGVTKIDVSGASPMASIELTGTTNYAFYIANNKGYLNLNGDKSSFALESDLSNLIDATQEALGAYTQFDPELITDESIEFAGVDKDNATVIKFNLNEETRVMIVIHNEKIMKVLYSNDDAIEYVAKYDYNAVTVELPSDLDSYNAE